MTDDDAPPQSTTNMYQELRGRATTEPATVDGYAVFENGNDGHGHGTHCAGTAAGGWVY